MSGGCVWSDSTKKSFTLGGGGSNLNPVTASFLVGKDTLAPYQLTGIAARIIDTAPEKCRYARQIRAVKREWRLLQPEFPRDSVEKAWLEGC